MIVTPRGAPPMARALLAGTTLLGALESSAIDELTREVEWLSLLGGEALFRQGDAADALYIVVSGRLRVLVETGGETRLIREVGRSETVGELALLTGEPRSATVVAARATERGRISRATFDRLLEQHPHAIHGLTRVLAQWVVQSNRAMPRDASPALIAIVPNAGQDHCSSFARQLVAALEPFGPTLHVTSESIDQRFGAGTAHSQDNSLAARVSAWLTDLESEFRFIVCEAEYEMTSWTRRCLRQADRILVVANAFDTPRLGPIGQLLASPDVDGWARPAELVLLHRGSSSIAGRTRRFLSLAGFSSHHHLRLATGDVHRLARKLTGNALGLVLSGGGARAFAQLGVMRALEEEGVVIDRVGGASMGAVIAAQYACGYTIDTMIEMNREGWNGFKPHKDYTIPIISMVSSNKAHQMLEMMFGERHFEDLWLNCYAVSTNLTRSGVVVHRKGPLTKWLRASISIPGTAPPVLTDDGDLLVDGGVLENLPAAAMLVTGEGPVAAVDVLPTVDLTVDARYSSTPTPLRALYDQYAPFGERREFPNIFKILYRTALVSNIRSVNEVRA
jgi:predicted acylesterase/phospholipase RssA/CRP-like cAMP-binding protein